MSREAPARRLERLPYFLEDRVAPFEIGRQEIGGGVGVPSGARNQTILLQEIQVMSDRPVIESERRAELVCVVRPFAQRLDDPRSTHAPSRPCDQIPQQQSACS